MSQDIRNWMLLAVNVAMRSPCQSKHGAIICCSERSRYNLPEYHESEGYNHQPHPFICDSSDQCKSNCGKTAIHAEQAAILTCDRSLLRGASIFHVKAYTSKPCTSIAPSCLECSKLILKSGVAWIHLLHDPTAELLPGAVIVGEVDGFTSDGSIGTLPVCRYSAPNFHSLTTEYYHRIQLKVPERYHLSVLSNPVC